MSSDAPEPREGFLERWSRRKAEVRAAPAPAAEPTQPARVEDAPPELPPIEKLTIDSDFRDFFHPKVDETTRRAALRKLFSDPHFNVMDGLDVYIDDYSKPDPIPAAMLAGLKHAQRIIDWARNKDEAPEEAVEPAPQLDAAAPEGPVPDPVSLSTVADEPADPLVRLDHVPPKLSDTV